MLFLNLYLKLQHKVFPKSFQLKFGFDFLFPANLLHLDLLKDFLLINGSFIKKEIKDNLSLAVKAS